MKTKQNVGKSAKANKLKKLIAASFNARAKKEDHSLAYSTDPAS